MSNSPPFLRRVRIRNYKSIAECDVQLGGFTVIVGRNGSGKSNFLDALNFVSEALVFSLDFAFKTRGGVDDVFCKTAKPAVIGIELELSLPDNRSAEYGFEIAWITEGRFSVQRESLRVQSAPGEFVEFKTQNGDLIDVRLSTDGTPFDSLPKPAFDRLYLVNISGVSQFRASYDVLCNMCFYHLNSETMRLPQKASSLALRPDGGNLASIAGRLFDETPALKQRLLEYLAVIVPEVTDIRSSSRDGWDYLSFQVQGIDHAWLSGSSMSDGTLLVLGHLVAGMQNESVGKMLSLVAIEEPETALHPAAAAVLLDALREAATQTQIIITSHSPDLLDGIDPDSDTLLVAQMRDGQTDIDVVDSAGASAIRDHLFSAGELLRLDQLQPRTAAFRESGEASTGKAVP